ncbi:LptF/LptG family permease [Capnocytophaga sp. ARDL2]|uniref:LptF/LptG family permease n=1 Tax=Capnocytophaga sp. ARDL2 TaxID=3238809 RepID=UPI003558461C
MKLIDWYILKRYLGTFFVLFLMFIPIAIVIDVTEKINKILQNEVPMSEIIKYYFDFTIYFANILFPIFLFISVIWFTSKLANNTEIVAILSSGISYTRFLRPYLIGSTIISIMALLMGLFIVPKASEGYNNFKFKYLTRSQARANANVYKQIAPGEYIYISNFDYDIKLGYNFTLEKFKENSNELEYKIEAYQLKYIDTLSQYRLTKYIKRTIGEKDDLIETHDEITMPFNFEVDDLTPTIYAAETMQLKDLNNFIEKEKMRGSPNIGFYEVVKYRKYSVPVSAFILTIIAVAVSSMKRRGGMGINLAIGVALAFSYVFFDKIFGTLAEASNFPPLLGVWIPNVLFGILAIYLLKNAKR